MLGRDTRIFSYGHQLLFLSTLEKVLLAMLALLIAIVAWEWLTEPIACNTDHIAWLKAAVGEDEFVVIETAERSGLDSTVVMLTRSNDLYDVKNLLKADKWIIEDDSAIGQLPGDAILGCGIVGDRTLSIKKGRCKGEVTILLPNLYQRYEDRFDNETGLRRNTFIFISTRDSKE